jgi:hypothetical protein
MTIREYADKHGSFFSKFASHACKVCQKAIRWDSDTIIAHLYKIHAMTPGVNVITKPLCLCH